MSASASPAWALILDIRVVSPVIIQSEIFAKSRDFGLQSKPLAPIVTLNLNMIGYEHSNSFLDCRGRVEQFHAYSVWEFPAKDLS